MAGKGEGKSERRGGTERERCPCFQFHFCCGSVINLQSKHFEFGLKGEQGDKITDCHIDLSFLYPV